MTQTRRMMWNGTVRALPPQEQLRASAIARCEAVSITPSDYNAWLGKGISTRDLLTMADDAGVRLTHLDPLVRWVGAWQPDLPGENFPTDAIAFDIDDFLRMAAALKVESFTAWAGFPVGRYEMPQLVDAFGALCRKAAYEGLRCDLEFIPVFGIPDLRTAWTIIDSVGAPNSGIVLDLWHYMRSGRDDDLLRSIPGDRISGVQLCDATATIPAGISAAYDGLNNRRWPGEADFPINEIVDVLRQTGGLNIVGPEIFSPIMDQMKAEVIGRTAGGILDRFLPG